MNNEQGKEKRPERQDFSKYGKFAICFAGLFALVAAFIFTAIELAAGMSILEALNARRDIWIIGAINCFIVFRPYPNPRSPKQNECPEDDTSAC